MKQINWLFFALFAILSTPLLAQETSFTSNADAPYDVKVQGSSTLTDWEAKAATVKDYPAALSLDLSGAGTIETFGFKVEVASMDGGRGSSMNGKIYKALKSETHPDIIYTQTEPAGIEKLEDGQLKIISKGNLNIAGFEKAIEVEVTGSLEDGVLTFAGEKALKLSEFEIEPPSAMFGQIQTKDDITVHFSFAYIQQ